MKMLPCLLVAAALLAAPAVAQTPYKLPPGVTMTAEDYKNCGAAGAATPCTVWTQEQLLDLYNRAEEAGVRKGLGAGVQLGRAQFARELRDAMEAEHNKELQERNNARNANKGT